jgi:hypothetical protein
VSLTCQKSKKEPEIVECLVRPEKKQLEEIFKKDRTV